MAFQSFGGVALIAGEADAVDGEPWATVGLGDGAVPTLESQPASDNATTDTAAA